MGPDEMLFWARLARINPQLGNFISQAYTGQVNPIPYTNSIITALGQLGIPITQQGILNAHRFALNTMNPGRRQFSDLNHDGIYGGLADFAKVITAGANGVIWL